MADAIRMTQWMPMATLTTYDDGSQTLTIDWRDSFRQTTNGTADKYIDHVDDKGYPIDCATLDALFDAGIHIPLTVDITIPIEET